MVLFFSLSSFFTKSSLFGLNKKTNNQPAPSYPKNNKLTKHTGKQTQHGYRL